MYPQAIYDLKARALVQLRKRPLEELKMPFSTQCLLRPVQKDRGPGMYRWIDVTEIAFVRRNLTSRMSEVLLQHQIELLFREIHIDC